MTTATVGREAFAQAWPDACRGHAAICEEGEDCGIAQQLVSNLRLAQRTGTRDLSEFAPLWLDHGLEHIAGCPSDECHFNEMFQRAAHGAGVGPTEFRAELDRVLAQNPARAVARYEAGAEIDD